MLNVSGEYGHMSVVKILLKKRANVNKADCSGWTALHKACQNNQLAAAKILIERGADINRYVWHRRTLL
jgi:ankyrin repeat protein